MHLLATRRGQSTAEYAVVIAFVLAAVIGMQTYVKRALQAKYRMASFAVSQVKPAAGQLTGYTNLEQYEPYYAKASSFTERKDIYDEKFEKGGKVTRTGALSESVRNAGGTQEELNATALTKDQNWQ